ncbi:MAG: hypothetical protein AMJ79_12125 [Phycisphaerae bacterium SM23_30]|nr:MAG: hypothetical protein AMJ79_12125 [Phycisphaerae bacterium SM23_30]
MSQARTIYEYLSRTENEAADKALLLGWRRAEEPYRTALLEVMLDRGTPKVTSELIRQYHQFSPPWQGLMRERVDVLYGGMFQAGRAKEVQGRLNCLHIIKHTRYMRLADLVVNMLRDRAGQVSREAAATLLELVRSFNSEGAEKDQESTQARTAEERSEQFRRTGGKISNREILLSALKRAVDSYPVHKRSEAVLGAMCVIRADKAPFWREKLLGYHPVGRAVRHILLNHGGAELAGFCLSALRQVDLRSTAVRAISAQKKPGFIAAMARQFQGESDELVLRGLKMVRRPSWLGAGEFRRGAFSPEDQLDIVDLVLQLGASVEEKVTYLCAVGRSGSEAAGLKAVARLGEMQEEAAVEGLVRLMSCGREIVALAAAWQLIKTEPPQLHRVMIEQLNGSHEQVRALAWGYYRSIAFKRYWENFERLPPLQRAAAGRAVFKIDRKAHDRWLRRARDESARQRLRAVRVARLLGRLEECFEELKRLACDADRKVRSCAVAGLGEFEKKDESIQRLLKSALKDEDHRVRANAIEALEQQGREGTAELFERFVNDDNNRVRANAIKALLSMKVASARKAVQEMLRDRRAPHRGSARWVVQTLQENAGGGIKHTPPGPEEQVNRRESSYDNAGVVMV